jgi:translation elongation factor P/translation initiation factor 5A
MNHKQAKENAPNGAELYALIKCKIEYFYMEGNKYFFMNGKEYSQANITRFYKV